MINKAIEFLKKVEGYTTYYYIPKDSKGNILGHSGITIGLGIDLGQHSCKEMLGLGLTKDILCKICKALEITGEDAEKLLPKLEHLTKYEIYELSKVFVIKGLDTIYSKLKGEYPDEVIIVALSLYHQFGNKLFKYNAFKQIKDRDYKALLANLRNFGCNYPTRRNIEAYYLEKALKEQGLL